MLIRFLMVVTFCVGSSVAIHAQSTSIAQNNVYAELGGAAFFYSVNYERLWLKNPRVNIATRIGLTYIPVSLSDRTTLGVPMGISYLKLLKRTHFEFGLTYCGLRQDFEEKPNEVTKDGIIRVPSARLGLRKQPQQGGLFWNVFLQGSFFFVNKERPSSDVLPAGVLPFLGFGIGKSF